MFSPTAIALTHVSLQKSMIFNGHTEDLKGFCWFDFAGFFGGVF